ncbi:MAG: tetratricopeptide repeat protein [Bacteroidetes bacterium]|nr:tetratricopeptide repeat protein [Bacteroidota bacterium]
MSGKTIKNIPSSKSPVKKQNVDKKVSAENVPKWAPYAILLFTALLYSKAIFNGITNFDDDFYIIKNPFIRDFSWHGIKAIFTSFYSSNYHPLTTLTYLFEYSWFGLNPLPYHLLNVLLHLLNVLLIFKFIEKLSGKKVTALVVSLLFAVHPMHVESVAWISERKDVLYSMFYLLSLFAYMRYLETGFRTKQYVAALMFFLASLFSKSAAVTLPVLLIAIDIYKGRKINIKLILEKSPFFLLSLIFGIVTLFSQGIGGSISNSVLSYGFINKIFLLSYAVSFYIIKLIAPFNLCAMHYFPDLKGGALPWQYYLSLPFLLVIAWLLIKITSFRKEMLFGVFFFLITISVMLQIVSVGSALTAERYTYISYIGFFYIAGQLISCTEKKQQKIVIGIFSLFIIMFSVQTWNRIKIWKDSKTLTADLIEKNPDVYYGYWLRGNLRNTEGNLEGALQDYNKAILLNPAFEDSYYNRGHVLDDLGDVKSAILDYNKSIILNPKLPDAYNNRGWAYYKSGDTKAAMLDYDKAISLNPGYAEAYNNRGWAHQGLGDVKAALHDYTKAILSNPHFLKPCYNRAALKLNTGDFAGAIEDFNNLEKLNSNDNTIYYNRGVSRLNMKDIKGACQDWKKAMELGNEAAAKMMEQYCR